MPSAGSNAHAEKPVRWTDAAKTKRRFSNGRRRLSDESGARPFGVRAATVTSRGDGFFTSTYCCAPAHVAVSPLIASTGWSRAARRLSGTVAFPVAHAAAHAAAHVT